MSKIAKVKAECRRPATYVVTDIHTQRTENSSPTCDRSYNIGELRSVAAHLLPAVTIQLQVMGGGNFYDP